jgi:hypothetical protein
LDATHEISAQFAKRCETLDQSVELVMRETEIFEDSVE